ncbi:MAG: peptidylprolyl isomerase [Xanthomonadales bacterium]|nr:Chaperone SurA [Xanthomonadales bacterium]MCC6593014.1 peptidylprolyl isomerase [Xanthomonadales bacterium]MCE7931056.1 rotamase [Xanthomonadales bacterium PRO6]
MGKTIPIHVHAGADHTASDPTGHPLPGPAPVWLYVGERGIDEAEIAREMQHHRAADPHQARSDAARALVVRELLRLEVARLGLESSLETDPGETLEEASIRVLIERETRVPTVDAAACERYCEQNRERLRHPDRIQLRHILLAAAPADASARHQARAQGEALLETLRSHPERFGELARSHSACPSRERDGAMGWIERGQTPPEFERQIFTLRLGLAGTTVESRYGHHVVQVDAIERGTPLTPAEALPKVRTYLETQARQHAIQQYLQGLAARYNVRGL